jgi:N utilization substance protein A
MKTEFALAFNEVLEEKQLPKDVILAAIESAMVSAYRKSVNASNAQEVQVKIDLDSGSVKVLAEKEVSEMITDDRTEVTLEEARKYNPEVQIGDLLMVESTPENFGRVAAQTARQVIQQRIRDAEKTAQFEFFGKQMGEIVSGVIQAVNSRQASIGLDLKAEGTMQRKDMIPGERFRIHDRIRAYIYEVKDTPRGLQILMSRAHRNFLRRLLENEVPEIYHGIVEIRSIAREPGQRAKVAVSATQQGIDPVGACVGIRGVRIQTIVRELHDEKIDVIEWSNDAAVYISKAVSPARVSGVYLNTETEGNKTAMVVVPEDQLSLAIGREGQNARLAAKLTGWRIDIMSLTEATARALQKLRESPSLSELAASESENIPKIEDLLQKKAEGRPLSIEDNTFMTRFVDRIEKRGEADRKAEDEALQTRIKAIKALIPAKAFETPILDVELKEHILIILQEADIESLGDLILRVKLDPDSILSINGIGPKAHADIIDLVENLKFPEEVVAVSAGEAPEEAVEETTETLAEIAATPVEEPAGTVISEGEVPEVVSEVSEEVKEQVVEEVHPEITAEPHDEELVFEELFKVDSEKFDFGSEDEGAVDEEGALVDDDKKKKSKKKKGYTVEYDPDKDQATVKRKHKRDDAWEDW